MSKIEIVGNRKFKILEENEHSLRVVDITYGDVGNTGYWIKKD